MISFTQPSLHQQAQLAIETELGNWFADPSLGSSLHQVNQLKASRQNYLKLRKSLLQAIAHLPVEIETWQEGQTFCYKIMEPTP